MNDKQRFVNYYLDYVKNFASVDSYAMQHGLTQQTAQHRLDIGKEIYRTDNDNNPPAIKRLRRSGRADKTNEELKAQETLQIHKYEQDTIEDVHKGWLYFYNKKGVKPPYVSKYTIGAFNLLQDC